MDNECTMAPNTTIGSEPLIDAFGRRISYLRLSVTDRCDLRCAYCMPERMQFSPKAELLTYEELAQIADAFIARGVDRIRLTGGEPLVRRDIMQLIELLSAHLASGHLRELTMTTNATQLASHARQLYALGMRRINVSLDSLDPEKFAAITRRPMLDKVLSGIDEAIAAGLKVKINAVALRDWNLDEIPMMIDWAHRRGMDFTLIEVMPMGEIDGDRRDQYAPLTELRARLADQWTLEPLSERTGGPARYFRLRETGGKLGFITPLTNNFCDGCNRVRVSCTGQLFMCLGQEDKADLRAVLRNHGPEALGEALDDAMLRKPKGHDFQIDGARGVVATPRVMSATGG